MRTYEQLLAASKFGISELQRDHREAIDAALTEEVPTRGWWWWRSLDSKKAKQWLFESRARVWALLYGSTSYGRP